MFALGVALGSLITHYSEKKKITIHEVKKKDGEIDIDEKEEIE
jgi:hypothetical protein